jgi:hypothetical protein
VDLKHFVLLSHSEAEPAFVVEAVSQFAAADPATYLQAGDLPGRRPSNEKNASLHVFQGTGTVPDCFHGPSAEYLSHGTAVEHIVCVVLATDAVRELHSRSHGICSLNSRSLRTL